MGLTLRPCNMVALHAQHLTLALMLGQATVPTRLSDTAETSAVHGLLHCVRQRSVMLISQPCDHSMSVMFLCELLSCHDLLPSIDSRTGMSYSADKVSGAQACRDAQVSAHPWLGFMLR